jgi:S-adenosylmethionine hydrolase
MAIVTLTTDFGSCDAYAGAMKGVVLSMAPDVVLVDITHEVPAHDVITGAFTLAQAARYFPPGAIHIAVVDPGVGGPRADVVVEAGGQYFVGPDNGLLTMAALPPRVSYCIQNPDFRRDPVCPTFHGRDVLAVAAGCLARGVPANQAGPALTSLSELSLPPACTLADGGQGEVIHVDHFGNLITSFDVRHMPSGEWELELEWHSRRLNLWAGATYSDVAAGQMVLYPGSGGRLEIAVRDGSASETTGARRGARITLRKIQ